MGAWESWIGREQRSEDILTSGLLARFRGAIDNALPGDDVPQGIHWCLCLPNAATSVLGKDGHPRRDDSPGSFLPPIPLPRRMWASSKVNFKSPISIGAEIERISTIATITEKQGGSGLLTFVEIDHATMANGVLAIEERQTIVYREAATALPAPAPPEIDPDLNLWDWHRALRPTTPLLFRYSALTFNSHRIHYDSAYAQDEEMYRGLVVHGPLTATLLLDLAAQQLGPNRLSSFAFRGASPAFAGEPLHLVGRVEGDHVTLAALGGDAREVMVATAVVCTSYD